MKIYQDSNDMFWLDDTTCPGGTYALKITEEGSISLIPLNRDNNNTRAYYDFTISELEDEEGTTYTSIEAFKEAVGSFFVKASGAGGMRTDTYDPQGIETDTFDRSNHTGMQAVSTISDFDTEVSNNASVTSNTAKVTAKWFDDGTNEIYSGKFTKLGDTTSPAIKQKLITGTTPGLEATSYFTTSLTHDQILSFTVIVSDDQGVWELPQRGVVGTGTYYYVATISASGQLIMYVPGASTSVYACSFKALITYTE